jgi:cytochrome c biogenesis protein CcdA
MLLATIVDPKDLWQTVVASIASAVGITVIFSLAIYGATRFADLSRDERRVAATASGALAILSLLATLAAIVFGIVVMTTK